jgi:hypothetical protein
MTKTQEEQPYEYESDREKKVFPRTIKAWLLDASLKSETLSPTHFLTALSPENDQPAY